MIKTSTPMKISINDTISSDRTFREYSFTSDTCEKFFIQPNYNNPSAKSNMVKSRSTLKSSLNTSGDNLT